MASDVIELKPCPFCGKLPTILDNKVSYGIVYWVECDNPECHLIVRGYAETTKRKAAKLWNRRDEDE